MKKEKFKINHELNNAMIFCILSQEKYRKSIMVTSDNIKH